MKKILKKLLPENLLLQYHRLLAHIAAIQAGNPSKDVVIIGVTGTKGKTSTSHLMWQFLNNCDIPTGLISTAGFGIGTQWRDNDLHMTMPGRLTLQKLIRECVDAGCSHVIVETSSEGIKQYRHAGITYDIAVFTNLSPEHLPSHGGSFEKYRAEKLKLFRKLNHAPKIIHGENIAPLAITNTDDEHSTWFNEATKANIITFSQNTPSDYQTEVMHVHPTSVDFRLHNETLTLPLIGSFNVYNIAPSLIIADRLSIPKDLQKQALTALTTIPGRAEPIDIGQDFKILVDYAHEARSMEAILKTGRTIVGDSNRVIVLLGAEGGGRDKAKRSSMPKLSHALADITIVTNVDPYDDDPMEIITDITNVLLAEGGTENTTYYSIPDRREAIQKSFSLATTDDIVLVTGKGAELTMSIGGKTIAWDERKIITDLLKEHCSTQ